MILAVIGWKVCGGLR